MTVYRELLRTLTSSLSFRGRILLGCSSNEGVNGTFSGSLLSLSLFAAVFGIELSLIKPSSSDDDVEALITDALSENAVPNLNLAEKSLPVLLAPCVAFLRALQTFHSSPSTSFPPFLIPCTEFKWSENTTVPQTEVFPDLYLKLVAEIVGSGGKLSNVTIDQTSEGYLTPQQFHAELTQHKASLSAAAGSPSPSDTILIDCRNDKECKIGGFTNSINPKTKTFYEFPKWVDDNFGAGGIGGVLEGKKKVLMYCTGG